MYANSNEKAFEKLNSITDEVIKEHKIKSDNYIASIESKLTNLINQKNNMRKVVQKR